MLETTRITRTGPDRLKEPPGTRSISSRMAIAEAGGTGTTRVGRARRALDALNFFLADVRGGLGPYLAIYLLTVRNWNEAEIGIVMSISTIAGILAETPGGALIDAIRAKRTVVALAALVVTAGSLLLPFLSTFLAVALSQATVSAVGSIFGPAIAAISLGMVGHAHFARRTGRNELFITPVTPSPQQLPAVPLTCGDRASCSSLLQLWQWQVLSVCNNVERVLANIDANYGNRGFEC